MKASLRLIHHFLMRYFNLRWLNTVLGVCKYMSFAKSWQDKGCSSQAETSRVKNILTKDFDWKVKFDILVVSMVTWTIEYDLKISLLLSLHKIRSLDFPINLKTTAPLQVLTSKSCGGSHIIPLRRNCLLWGFSFTM